MKRCWMISVLCALMLVVSAQAVSFGSLAESADADEIQALAPQIVDWCNDVIQNEPSLGGVVAASDLDWNAAYPVYLDSSVFQLDTASTAAILGNLTAQDCYIWQVPVSVPGASLLVSLQIGGEPDAQALALLDEQTQAEVQNNIGRWSVSSVAIQGDTPDWRTQMQLDLQAFGLDNADTQCILLGNEAGTHTMIGLAGNVQRMTHMIPLQSDLSLDGAEERTASGARLLFTQDTAYTFADAAASLSQIQPVASDANAAGGRAQADARSSLPVVPFVCVVLVVCGVGFYLFRRKRV